MNTEAINTLKLIREDINILQEQLNDESLQPNERRLIEHALANLYDLENIIIIDSLKAMVDKINATNCDLQNLIAEMQKSSAKIARLAEVVQKVSNVVATLAEITAKAISAGIAG